MPSEIFNLSSTATEKKVFEDIWNWKETFIFFLNFLDHWSFSFLLNVMTPKRHEQTLLNFCYVGIVWRASKRPSIQFEQIAKEKSLDSKYEGLNFYPPRKWWYGRMGKHIFRLCQASNEHSFGDAAIPNKMKWKYMGGGGDGQRCNKQCLSYIFEFLRKKHIFPQQNMRPVSICVNQTTIIESAVYQKA